MSRVDSVGINEEIVKGVIDPMKAENMGLIDPYEDYLRNEYGTMTGIDSDLLQADPAAARQRINAMMNEVADGYKPKMGESAYKGARGLVS